jgi:RimJ/RimL family protein N-acetyltransferase
MPIKLVNLSEIPKQSVIEFMNNSLVKKHLPLAQDKFDDKAYDKFIETKNAMWKENSFGVWAFTLDEKFIGWGGLQPEGEDVEIALLLHPNYWGMGKQLYEIIIKYAFNKLKLQSVIILFPPSRTRIKAILNYGFIKEKEHMIDGVSFICYRLKNKLA